MRLNAMRRSLERHMNWYREELERIAADPKRTLEERADAVDELLAEALDWTSEDIALYQSLGTCSTTSVGGKVSQDQV
jgi:hypothetical protein